MNLINDETSAANVNTTHAVDIFAFVEAEDIPFSYFETPYYLAPAPGDEKVYALLRETLNRTKKIGIAHVVIQTRRHVAALIPCGPVLVLNTLRLADQNRSSADLSFPGQDVKAGEVTDRELAMAVAVVDSMTKKWDLNHYRDALRNEITTLGQRKNETENSAEIVSVPSEKPDSHEGGSGDLADLLRRSIHWPNDEIDSYQAQRESRPRGRPRRTLH